MSTRPYIGTGQGDVALCGTFANFRVGPLTLRRRCAKGSENCCTCERADSWPTRRKRNLQAFRT